MMTSDLYVEKANDLFATLGDEYSLMLATKFVDGITDGLSSRLTVSLTVTLCVPSSFVLQQPACMGDASQSSGQ